MYNDFNTKFLYRQQTITEENHTVTSSVYGLSWILPGGTTTITSRARMTIITNFDDKDHLNVSGASIELWRDRGWIFLEELFDNNLQRCNSALEVEKKCLEVLTSFHTGETVIVPDVDEEEESSTNNELLPKNVKVIDFTRKK